MEDRSRVAGVSERLYRALLVAYPKEFRRQYSEQLVQAFGDLCREELEQHGKKGLLVFWLRTLGDLVGEQQNPGALVSLAFLHVWEYRKHD